MSTSFLITGAGSNNDLAGLDVGLDSRLLPVGAEHRRVPERIGGPVVGDAVRVESLLSQGRSWDAEVFVDRRTWRCRRQEDPLPDLVSVVAAPAASSLLLAGQQDVGLDPRRSAGRGADGGDIDRDGSGGLRRSRWTPAWWRCWVHIFVVSNSVSLETLREKRSTIDPNIEKEMNKKGS